MNKNGFALPTVLITSIAMMIVLLAALQSIASVSSGIRNLYYEKVLRETGESGVVMANTCLKKGGASWTSPLRPGSDCSGSATVSYTNSDSTMRSTFEVLPGTVTGDYVNVTVNTKVELLRTSNGQAWKTYTGTTNANILYPIFDIYSGNDSTCATINGKLYCWGSNNYGQLADGTTNDVLTPFRINTGAIAGKYVYKAATGFYHICALAGPTSTPSPKSASNPGVFCWGDNTTAQLGIGTTTNSPSYRTPMAAATTLPNNYTYTDISGSSASCAIGENSGNERVFCWGDNDIGQAGDNDSNNPKKTPTEGTITTDNGVIRYARDNSSTDSTSHSTTLNDAVQINSVSSSGGCVITAGSKALCWGTNGKGNLGVGTDTNGSINNSWRARSIGATVASPITTGYKFSKVATNYGRQCALGVNSTNTTTGKIYCWGSNGGENDATDYRMTSLLSTSQISTPVAMVPSGTYASATFKDIAVSNWATCALRSDGANDGKVYCWGYNHDGRLGNGTTTPYVPITEVTPSTANKPLAPTSMSLVGGILTGQKVERLVAGNNHFCVMTESTASYCWGGNAYGQLGDGTRTDRPSPVKAKVPDSVQIY